MTEGQAGTATRTVEAQDRVRAARELETMGAWEDAERTYARALELDPLSADAHGFLAALQVRRRGVVAARRRARGSARARMP